MSWKGLALRYTWRIALGEVLRSRRWSDADKRVGILGLGFVVAVAVVLSWIVWLLTGRGPVRHLLASGGFVEPFPPPDPAHFLGRDEPLAPPPEA